jgi:putative endonuclease
LHPDRSRRSSPDRQQLGRSAEDAATRFLEEHGLTIRARNYRCRAGELDIIAETQTGVIVIAEVRLRADARYGGGAASVDWRKQRRIQRAASHLLLREPALARRPVRFDVLDLAPSGPQQYRIEWIRQAFESLPR